MKYVVYLLTLCLRKMTINITLIPVHKLVYWHNNR